MSSRLVNVRLDQEHLRKAKVLRQNGIALSDLVRTAIDEKYDQALVSRPAHDVPAILARLDLEYPISAGTLPERKYSVHDRQQAARAIRKGLARSSRRRRRR